MKLPTSVMAAIRSHGEAMELEANVKRWDHEQRRLVFPNEVGRVTRYGTFAGKVWTKLIEAAKLPYRKPHAMRHSFATWMLEEGADLRYVEDQMGHASIEETEGTYGHLQRERHEQRVDLDQVLGRPAASTGVHEGRRHDAEQAELRDLTGQIFMVEGKGFEPSTSALRTPRSPN